NPFVVSVAWSLMADVFDAPQARRMFAFIAAGASVGGLVGPAASALLVGALGQFGLMLLAALLLALAVVLKHYLMAWRDVAGAGRPRAERAESPRRPVGRNPFSRLTLLLGSSYLLGLSSFVLVLTTASIFLYFEQPWLVAGLF